MVDSKTGQNASDLTGPVRRSTTGRALRGMVRLAAALVVAAGVVATVGFLVFVSDLPTEEVTIEREADGIVVLTGGSSRITDAIELLAAGRGRRLLISGAHPATNSTEILRLNPEFAKVVKCCIDLDRSVNTLGNAIETRRWVERRGFRSLIVVTSSYHMPRAMAEIAHQLPGVALVTFPVVPDRLRDGRWWTNGVTVRLLLSEYLKYLFARVRMRIDPDATAAVETSATSAAAGAPADAVLS
jgi:uncharacterized SAM-binding protein YcdF (DUF218 family)